MANAKYFLYLSMNSCTGSIISSSSSNDCPMMNFIIQYWITFPKKFPEETFAFGLHNVFEIGKKRALIDQQRRTLSEPLKNWAPSMPLNGFMVNLGPVLSFVVKNDELHRELGNLMSKWCKVTELLRNQYR